MQKSDARKIYHQFIGGEEWSAIQITTAAGLIVAIPLILAHHAISAKVDRLVFEMDTKTIEFMESLSDLESRRPGAISAPGCRSSSTSKGSFSSADTG